MRSSDDKRAGFLHIDSNELSVFAEAHELPLRDTRRLARTPIQVKLTPQDTSNIMSRISHQGVLVLQVAIGHDWPICDCGSVPEARGGRSASESPPAWSSRYVPRHLM